MRYASCSDDPGAAHENSLRALDRLAVLERLARRLGVLPRRQQAPCARVAARRIVESSTRGGAGFGKKRDRRRRRHLAIAQRQRVIAAEQHDRHAGQSLA